MGSRIKKSRAAPKSLLAGGNYCCGRQGRQFDKLTEDDETPHRCGQKHTLGFFFLPAPGTFALRDGDGLSIEDPPLRPLQHGRVAVMAKPLRPPLTTLVPLFGMESSKFARPVGDGDGAKPRSSSREAAAMYA